MLTHVNEKNIPTMVDVSQKEVTLREATAESRVWLPNNIVGLLNNGEIISKKGPVFQTAIIAGTMAAKKTHELIPFCHPLPIEGCNIEIKMDEGNDVLIRVKTKVTSKTGVEMEALMAASVAALTVYDMCKALSHNIVIRETKLVSKTGGKSDYHV